MENNTTNHWRVYIAVGVVLIALSLGAVTLDGINNWNAGSKISIITGGIFAVAAGCVAILPAVSTLIHPLPITKWAVRACLALTLLCAFMTFVGDQGAAYSSATITAKDIADARKTLDAITELGSVQELEDLKKASISAREAICPDRPRSERCRAADAEMRKAIERASQAKARDAARTRLESAEVKSAHTSTQASALSGTMSVYGYKIALSELVSYTLTILMICVIQALALHAEIGVHLVAKGWAARPKKTAAVSTPTAVEIAAPQRRRKDDIYAAIALEIRNGGGKLQIASGNAFADALGVSRSTFANWIKEWVATRLLAKEQAAHGNIILTLGERAPKARLRAAS